MIQAFTQDKWKYAHKKICIQRIKANSFVVATSWKQLKGHHPELHEQVWCDHKVKAQQCKRWTINKCTSRAWARSPLLRNKREICQEPFSLESELLLLSVSLQESKFNKHLSLEPILNSWKWTQLPGLGWSLWCPHCTSPAWFLENAPLRAG